MKLVLIGESILIEIVHEFNNSPGNLGKKRGVGGHNSDQRFSFRECLRSGVVLNILKVHSDPLGALSPRGPNVPLKRIFSR